MAETIGQIRDRQYELERLGRIAKALERLHDSQADLIAVLNRIASAIESITPPS